MSSGAGLRRAGGLVIAASWLPGLPAALLDPRVFTSPDPRVKLEVIASRPKAWTGHAFGFPAAFALTALGYGLLSAGIEERRSRRLALAATGLGFASALLWLPISVNRLRLASRANSLLEEGSTETVDIGSWTFWPYTVAHLGSILAMRSALALSGLNRRLGQAVAGAAGLGLLGLPVLRDWPPFVSGLMTTVMGVGIVAGGER
jgi:hypothetical protein